MSNLMPTTDYSSKHTVDSTRGECDMNRESLAVISQGSTLDGERLD